MIENKLLSSCNYLINKLPEREKYLNSIKSPVVKTQNLNENQFNIVVNAVLIFSQHLKNIADMVCVTGLTIKLLVFAVVLELWFGYSVVYFGFSPLV